MARDITHILRKSGATHRLAAAAAAASTSRRAVLLVAPADVSVRVPRSSRHRPGRGDGRAVAAGARSRSRFPRGCAAARWCRSEQYLVDVRRVGISGRPGDAARPHDSSADRGVDVGDRATSSTQADSSAAAAETAVALTASTSRAPVSRRIPSARVGPLDVLALDRAAAARRSSGVLRSARAILRECPGSAATARARCRR